MQVLNSCRCAQAHRGLAQRAICPTLCRREASARLCRHFPTFVCSLANFVCADQCRGGFRTFTNNAKKFSPKQHRQRVGAMSDKPCPLHDLHRRRRCKEADNPNDKCEHFNPNRSRCAAMRAWWGGVGAMCE